jgi:hypothetical protein
MLQAKWNQFRNTSNIFDEEDHSSNNSNSGEDNQNEIKFELSRTAEQISAPKDEFVNKKDMDHNLSHAHNKSE